MLLRNTVSRGRRKPVSVFFFSAFMFLWCFFLFCFLQIADIALRYHSCNNSHTSEDRTLTSDLLCCQSLLLPQSRTHVCEVCLSRSGPRLTSSSVRCTFPATAQDGRAPQSVLRHCCLNQTPVPASTDTETSLGCSNVLDGYSPFTQYSACCRTVEPQLVDSQTKEELDVENPSPSPPPPPPSLSTEPSSGTQQGDGGFTGLRCQTNRTLRFYLLDVDLTWPLAVRLGAAGNRTALLHQEAGSPADGSDSRSFAAIVNLKDEIHYVLHRNPATTLTDSLGKTTVQCV